MNKRQIIEIFLSIAVLILAITQLLSTIELRETEERLKQLEIDYKIYEMNLNELEENAEVQFEK